MLALVKGEAQAKFGNGMHPGSTVSEIIRPWSRERVSSEPIARRLRKTRDDPAYVRFEMRIVFFR